MKDYTNLGNTHTKERIIGWLLRTDNLDDAALAMKEFLVWQSTKHRGAEDLETKEEGGDKEAAGLALASLEIVAMEAIGSERERVGLVRRERVLLLITIPTI